MFWFLICALPHSKNQNVWEDEGRQLGRTQEMSVFLDKVTNRRYKILPGNAQISFGRQTSALGLTLVWIPGQQKLMRFRGTIFVHKPSFLIWRIQRFQSKSKLKKRNRRSKDEVRLNSPLTFDEKINRPLNLKQSTRK